MPLAIKEVFVAFLGLGIMVLVHEFGHFMTAKFFGVRVEVFSIGFGKRLFGIKRGDTDYRISLVPLGGYVKMAGEQAGDGTPTSGDDAEPRVPNDPGDFANHPRWQRILIGLSGPFSNFALAFVLMTGLYMMHNEVALFYFQPAVIDFVTPGMPADKAGIEAGDKIVGFDSAKDPSWEQLDNLAGVNVATTVPVSVERAGQVIHTSLAIPRPGTDDDAIFKALGLEPRIQGSSVSVSSAPGSVTPGMPAAKAGLKPGDVIAAVDGRHFSYVGSLLGYLQTTEGRPVDLTIQRGAQMLHLSVAPVMTPDKRGQPAYRLGFSPDPLPFAVEQLPLAQAARRSVATNLEFSGLIVQVLRRLFTRPAGIQELSGPIGIVQQTGQAISLPGWQPLIGEWALISLNLGIFNLLPIPILDGGMIVLLIIEGIIRRDLNQQFKERIYQVAFVALILFAGFVMFNDVTRLSIFSKLKP